MNQITFRIIGTIGAGLQFSVSETAILVLTPGFIDVPLAGIVIKFAAAAWTAYLERHTCLAISPTASDFSNRHY